MAEINKYNSSLIYTIRSHQTNKYYIGSTTQSLSRRLSEHIRDYKKYLVNNDNKYMSSYEILQYNDYYIELLISYPCNSRDELHRKEGELIRQYKSDVVNIVINGRTYKQYTEDNKTHIAEKCKQYAKEHQVSIAERMNRYREDNSVHIKEQVKQYYEDNSVHIKEQMRQPIICNCGIISSKGHILRHHKSNIHTTNINNLYLHELNYYNF